MAKWYEMMQCIDENRNEICYDQGNFIPEQYTFDIYTICKFAQ